MEFRLLGDTEAHVDGRHVDVGHTRQRCVLATLLIQCNQPVSVDQLLDRAWGHRSPECARATLYSYLSRLRRVLAALDVPIVRQPGGYVLTADPMAVDLHRFDHLTSRARAADDDADAVALYGEAFALWRGEALAMLDTPWLNTVRESLHRRRLAAELDRNDLILRNGGHAGLVDELTAVAAEHPLDERLAGQLLLALYRCGRQGDALHAFEQIRRRLAEELGADPSPPLRQLHQQILVADPGLTVSAPVTVSPRSARSPVPRQLPVLPASFTGRARELAQLDAFLTPIGHRPPTAVISAIGGTGGVGKTWLAMRWAHDNLQRFPDGQLYVNLRGFDPSSEPVSPAEAIRVFLDALGVPAADLPTDPEARAALYRDLVADKHLLIVVDNARDTAQVMPLLPGSATCTVLVTSRHQLTGLLVTHGARPVILDMLTEAEARQLLTHHLGVDRVTAEAEAVTLLLRHCAGLPLALGIIAARAAVNPALPLSVLADELREASTRLDALDAGDLAVDLRAVLSCSYDALTQDAAQAFGLLSLAPGPDIGLSAAVSLAALPPASIRKLLRELAAAHLIQEHAPGRYRMHDLVRLYAAERVQTVHAEAGQRAALHRVLDHYLHTARTAATLLHPHQDPITLAWPRPGVAPVSLTGSGQALAWFNAEHPVLLTAVDQAASAGFDTHAWQLASALTTFLDRRGHWHDRIAVGRTALAAAERLTDRSAQAYAHRCLALAYIRLGCYDDAHMHLRHALHLFGKLDDRIGQAHTHRSLARALARQGHHRHALPHDQQALDLYRTAGHRAGQATALNAVGWHHTRLGDHPQALTYCRRALALHRENSDRHGQALTLDSLGYAHHHLGHHRQAVTCYQQALDLFREVGDRYNEATTLANLGDTHHAADHREAARDAWQRALTILDQLSHPDADQVRARLQEAPRRQAA